VLDEELTDPEDDDRPLEDELSEDELEVVELEELAVAAVLAVFPEDDADTPGIVSALTAPNTPTPAMAAKAMPAVMLSSSDSPRSRARILSAAFVLSTVVGCTQPLSPLCEEPGKGLRSYGLRPTNEFGAASKLCGSPRPLRPRSSGDRAGRS
jgi:hypothetical protein